MSPNRTVFRSEINRISSPKESLIPLCRCFSRSSGGLKSSFEMIQLVGLNGVCFLGKRSYCRSLDHVSRFFPKGRGARTNRKRLRVAAS
ncbi:hypothetical protein TNIN_156541 [Trichonephila inaurata madagascariensis]|uniref:Uncharacterized protein n=1 Tax=Trichonephila inaurata madagascariensis TaxID=2747483 RepID=A0A8X7BT93_9ARAC|nr:hypothetical protein TNIN_156541 [Trichonephila inaurata madagascariensis]